MLMEEIILPPMVVLIYGWIIVNFKTEWMAILTIKDSQIILRFLGVNSPI